jgi:hypothetical protein
MEATRKGDEITIICSPEELSGILKDLWGHSMGMAQPGRDLTQAARKVGVNY